MDQSTQMENSHYARILKIPMEIFFTQITHIFGKDKDVITAILTRILLKEKVQSLRIMRIILFIS
jgi:hypothetical protein